MVHPLSQKRPEQLPDLPSIVRSKDRQQADQARAFAAIKSRSMGPMTGMQDYSGGFKPLPNKVCVCGGGVYNMMDEAWRTQAVRNGNEYLLLRCSGDLIRLHLYLFTFHFLNISLFLVFG